MVFVDIDVWVIDDFANHEAGHHSARSVSAGMQDSLLVVSTFQAEGEAAVFHVEVHAFIDEFLYALWSFVNQDVDGGIIA